MINNEKLREFILDANPDVRREAACYFYEGYIQDPQILPLTLNACQRYGFRECSLLLLYASRQSADDFTANRLLDILRKTDNEYIQIRLARLINNSTSIDFLEKNIDALPTQFDKRQWDIARNRLKFKDYSAQQLWDLLKEYSKKCKNSQFETSYIHPLINALCHYDYPTSDSICELMVEDEIKGEWLEIFLIQLAAARKIEKAIPIISKKLDEDNFSLSDACSNALSEVGSETVLNVIKEDFLVNTSGYQISASYILSRIKLAQSETVIIDFLENHKEDFSRDIYYHLCFALCDMFSEKAFHYGKEIIDDIEAIEIDSMRERLIILSHILGTPLSPETRKQWEKEIALEPQRRKEHYKKKYPGMYKWGELIDGNFEKLGEFANKFNGLDENISCGQIIENIETDPFNKKIGRNEPCYCGSGKKYKKCCGRNNSI